MSRKHFRSALIPVLACLLLPAPADAAPNYFPWTCRKVPVTAGAEPSAPQADLQGEWISTFDPARVLDIRDKTFSLQGTGGNLKGSAVETGPSLLLTDQHGTDCSVIWQLLGDGRLSINSGEDLFHRRGEPAVPITSVRQFGSPDCRFTVTLPGVLPVEEIENGVRIWSMEKDAAMMILSGTDDAEPEKFASAICRQLDGRDFKAVDEEKKAFTFTATVHGIPMLQYVAKEEHQYLHVSLMGQYNKLMSYLRTVKMVPMEDLVPR
ncbi:MAG: hypothetical protein Q4F72_10795 [Desulfovibrionaceae bacterium]|nr:hypothetical protein [Desulfovibrionaceae bacterium]